MGGGKGGKSPKINIKPSPLEQKQVDIAERQQQRTEELNRTYFDPMRGLIQPNLMQVAQANPFATSLTGTERAPIEAQYNQAKQAIMNTAERGGRLRSQLAGLERDRASTIAGAANAARERGIGRALPFLSGAMPNVGQQLAAEQAATAGIGSALQSAQQRAMTEAQMKAQQQQSKGGGIGSLLGTGLGMFRPRFP